MLATDIKIEKINRKAVSKVVKCKWCEMEVTYREGTTKLICYRDDVSIAVKIIFSVFNVYNVYKLGISNGQQQFEFQSSSYKGYKETLIFFVM